MVFEGSLVSKSHKKLLLLLLSLLWLLLLVLILSLMWGIVFDDNAQPMQLWVQSLRQNPFKGSMGVIIRLEKEVRNLANDEDDEGDDEEASRLSNRGQAVS